MWKKLKGILGIKPKASGVNRYGDYLRGDTQETWPQALDRFTSFCLSLHAFYQDGEAYKIYFDQYVRDGTLFEWLEPVADSDLLNAETQNGFAMPDQLKALYAKRFAIYDVLAERGRWGDRRVLEIYGR
ncbi:MAG: hypothetical protein AAAB16_16840, partial [Pseudomonas sp.]|uniref:hypothetical protein n=1 Tax=Pseudomonas sp. TaxID=306 RepID=UPI0030F1F6F1